jgi:hypothetical protein
MRRAISDPTGGERAREAAAAPAGSLLGSMDPTDPRYAQREAARSGADPTDPQPVGHVFGHRRDEPLATPDPGAPVLRLRGFRRASRGGRARGT